MPSIFETAADFRRPPLGQRAAGHLPVADVAVGHRAEQHVMAQLGPLRPAAAGLVLRVVGMGAEDDDPQLAVIGRRVDGVERGRPDQATSSKTASKARADARHGGELLRRDMTQTRPTNAVLSTQYGVRSITVTRVGEVAVAG